MGTGVDIVFCGKKLYTLVLSGQTCEVKEFHNSLDAIQNVPVGKNMTDWNDLQAGATYLQIYNESHKFGIDMDHLLIDTTQSRLSGISVWDNPYNSE